MKVAMIDCPFISFYDKEANGKHGEKIQDLLKEHDVVICDASSRGGFKSLSGYPDDRVALSFSRRFVSVWPELNPAVKEFIKKLTGMPYRPDPRTAWLVPFLEPLQVYNALKELELETQKQPA
ncbi:MAG: hypothetical protein WDZ40_01065 [Candidatus Spechtbacterales bacterium]